MRKKTDLRKIKKRKCYTVSELSQTLNVTIQAIYWKIHHKELPVIKMDDGIIHIRGRDFCNNEKNIRASRKINRGKDEFLCFHCQKSVTPQNNEVSIKDFKTHPKAVLSSVIQLVGICPFCKNKIYRCSNISQLNNIKTSYKVVQHALI